MVVKQGKCDRVFMGRLERGDNPIEKLTAFCKENNIKAATINAIGAFESVTVSEYDQAKHVYKTPIKRDGAAELLSFLGNVSIKDNEPFLHIHVTCSYEVEGHGGKDCELISGHLNHAVVFALEFTMITFDTITLERSVEEKTKLSLWR